MQKNKSNIDLVDEYGATLELTVGKKFMMDGGDVITILRDDIVCFDDGLYMKKGYLISIKAKDNEEESTASLSEFALRRLIAINEDRSKSSLNDTAKNTNETAESSNTETADSGEKKE